MVAGRLVVTHGIGMAVPELTVGVPTPAAQCIIGEERTGVRSEVRPEQSNVRAVPQPNRRLLWGSDVLRIARPKSAHGTVTPTLDLACVEANTSRVVAGNDLFDPRAGPEID